MSFRSFAVSFAVLVAAACGGDQEASPGFSEAERQEFVDWCYENELDRCQTVAELLGGWLREFPEADEDCAVSFARDLARAGHDQVEFDIIYNRMASLCFPDEFGI